VTTSRLEWNLYVATADRGSKRYKAQSFLRFALASCAHRTASQLAEKSTNREFRCYHPKSCVGRIRVNVARDRASQPTFTKSYAKGIALWKVRQRRYIYTPVFFTTFREILTKGRTRLGFCMNEFSRHR